MGSSKGAEDDSPLPSFLLRVRAGSGDLSLSSTVPAKRLGWRRLLQSWDFFSLLPLILRKKKKGKRFPSLKKIKLSSPCAPASRKEPGRGGCCPKVQQGRAAALPHPPACPFTSFRKVLLQFVDATLKTLIHTLPPEQPLRSCSQPAALDPKVRGAGWCSSQLAEDLPLPSSTPQTMGVGRCGWFLQ